MITIPSSIKTLLKSKSMLGTDAPNGWIEFPDFGSIVLQVANMSVQCEEGADSQRLTFSIVNVNPSNQSDVGYFSPYRSTDFGKTPNAWYQIIVPSTKVVAKMGYGANIITVFTGEIDEVVISSNPNDYTIQVDCRDMACWLLDKQIYAVTDGVGEYAIEYPIPADGVEFWLTPGLATDPDIADIVKDLCMRAGFEDEDITIEATGIKIAPEYEKMCYMDAINELCTLSGFELKFDVYGKITFLHVTDRSPAVNDESHAAGNFTLVHYPIVAGSDLLYSAVSGGGTHWILDTNYTLDLSTGAVTNIDMTGTVYCSYVYAAHVYKEGEDLYGLDMTISRRNIYGTIRVAGDGDEAAAVVSNPMWDGSRVDVDKVMFADNPNLETEADCQLSADRLKLDMLCRYISADFSCVAHPWLQVGDCIQVIENASTISEIYKIMSISFDLSSDGFVSTIKAFHVGYSPL